MDSEASPHGPDACGVHGRDDRPGSMKMTNPIRRWLGTFLAWLLATLLPALAQAQELDELLQEALDQNVARIEIADQPLDEAFRSIEQQTGIRFVVDPSTYERMPYGKRTRVSVLLEATPLRAGLRRMTDRLGLTTRAEKDVLRVEPGPPLRRIDRRATIDELRVIERLAGEPWSPALRERVPIELRIDPAGKPADALNAALAQSGGGSALSQLDAATAALGWTWWPSEHGVVVVTRAEFIRLRLEHPVDLSYQRTPLDELLVDLGRRAGVTMLFEPGSLARIRARGRGCDLVVPNTTVRQALELICGRTGLQYAITSEGVSLGLSGAAGGPPRSDADAVAPALVRFAVPIDGLEAMVEFAIPEDQLPASLDELRRRRLAELLARIRPGGGAP